MLDLLNPHLIKIWNLKMEDLGAVTSVEPIELMTPDRLDVIAKYYYAKAYLNKEVTEWAKELYYYNIKAMTNNTFTEGDGSGKESFEQFLAAFHKVIDAIHSNGFDKTLTALPVSTNGVLIDGAHRLGASLACNKEASTLPILRHPTLHEYDWKFFKKRKTPTRFIDFMIEEYLKLKKNVYIVCLWPMANGSQDFVEETLSGCGKIIYQKTVRFNIRGGINFLAHAYEEHHWVGYWQNNYKGAQYYYKKCFGGKRKLRVFFVESNNFDTILDAKISIRRHFNIGNFSIHTTDNHEETLYLSKILLRQNTIAFFNKALMYKLKHFNYLFDSYTSILKTLPIERWADYCVDSSGVLGAYGIRDVRDLDYLTTDTLPVTFDNKEIGDHESNLKYYADTKKDILHLPTNHFYFKGLKFTTLDILFKMKWKRRELKDVRDIGLALIFLLFSNIIIFLEEVKMSMIRIGKKYVKKGVQVLKNIYGKVRYIGQPFIQKRTYLGYQLYFSRGTSIVERIKRPDAIYEKETSEMLVNMLQGKEKPCFVDIGSNIGLLSLYVHKFVPNVNIYAFEPGPHQYELFEKTITENKLATAIHLSQNALSNEEGEVNFYVHHHKDASGDGLQDTKRSGKVKAIKVASILLDNWWKMKGSPKVDLIKIDTEGAELMVLEGAIELIEAQKPKIILEICDLNYKSYPYDSLSIVERLHQLGYEITTFDGIEVTRYNIKALQFKAEYNYCCVAKLK